MLLTKEERDRFSKWCRNEANTSLGLLEQMDKMGAPEVLKKKFRVEMVAMAIVANVLDSIEDEVLIK